MVGRNFWATQDSGGWIVYEEGLPDETTRHPDREGAWAAAKRRAAEMKGEAFLKDERGEVADRQYYGDLPRDIQPV